MLQVRAFGGVRGCVLQVRVLRLRLRVLRSSGGMWGCVLRVRLRASGGVLRAKSSSHPSGRSCGDKAVGMGVCVLGECVGCVLGACWVHVGCVHGGNTLGGEKSSSHPSGSCDDECVGAGVRVGCGCACYGG